MHSRFVSAILALAVMDLIVELRGLLARRVGARAAVLGGVALTLAYFATTLPHAFHNLVDSRSGLMLRADMLRQEVSYQTVEAPGTIVVDTKAHYLYLVQANGKAIRYGVGLGRDGYAWSGRGVIQRKAKWPHWTPTDEMVEKNPNLRTVSAERGGLVAGLNNPLGARALYIYQNGKDTLYRVHGTPDWQSVGKATSSGCVRMFNQDVIDLFDRVPENTPIVVI